MISVETEDGTTVIAHSEGNGPAILIIHPGSDDGTSWTLVAEHLAARFRPVRILRRQYRLDLPTDTGFSMAQEVADVVALAAALTKPTLIVGHSSGAVVGLEALVARPDLFLGAVLYDQPATIERGLWDEPLERATAAIAAGRPGQAMTIFARDVVRTPVWLARVGGAMVGLREKYRIMAPRQIFDVKAINDLGVRLNEYARITTPTILFTGERSPSHLGERIDALAAIMPVAEKVVLPGKGHSAHKTASRDVAETISQFFDRLIAGGV